MVVPRVYLLSPASLAGIRAKALLDGSSRSELSRKLRSPDGATVGETFAFLSSLYFRGKLSYAVQFARPPAGSCGVLVITPDRGLIPPSERITLEDLKQMREVPIDAGEPRYRLPLAATAERLASVLGADGSGVLLGSIASDKYVPILLDALGERLLFPAEFIGRGDMSRGGLLLRLARSGDSCTYIAVARAVRHGARPPRLP